MPAGFCGDDSDSYGERSKELDLERKRKILVIKPGV